MKNIFDAISAIMGFMIFGGMFIGMVKTCVSGSNYHSSSTYTPSYNSNLSSPNNKMNNALKNVRFEEEMRRLKERESMQRLLEFNRLKMFSGIKGSSQSIYAILWNECEELESLLEENDIDHEPLEYPMDYYDLRNLRDDYQSLLDDNEIDY